MKNGSAPHNGLRAAAAWLLLTAFCYAAVGLAAMLLAGPPGYASPLFPAAGIALAAALFGGRPALAGVWLGSFLVNATLGWLRDQGGLALVSLPAVIALGAAAQAAVGAWLMRRHVSQPLTLDQPRDLARAGALGAALPCVISPTVATLALLAAGTIGSDGVAGNWLTWWAGDALGVLIAGPLALAFVGQPAEAWRPRRRGLGVPMLAALALLAAAMWAVAEREREHAQRAFAQEAERMAAAVQQRLQMPVHALQTLVAATQSSGRADTAALRAAASQWLEQGSPLQAMGVSVRVAQSDIAAFEAAAIGGGLAGFHVRERDEGRALAADGEAVVIRRIEPIAGNAAALGVNALSIPQARTAIMATRRSGGPSATAGFRLSQSAREETGVVLYQALGTTTVAADPVAGALSSAADGFQGVLFVSLRTEALFAGMAELADGARWCLLDPDPRATRPLLAGAAGCSEKDRAHARSTQRRVQLADRPLDLRLYDDGRAAAGGNAVQWLLTVAGFAATAMLGAWLLTVTGQALRTRRAVDAATADLRREVAERRVAEQERAGSEARLRSILDNAPLGIAFLDPHGKLLQGNPHLYRMLGSTPEKLLGRTVASMTHEEDLPELQRQHHDLLSGRTEVVRRPLRLMRGEGEALSVRIASTALRNESGRVQYMVAVLEDLTEHLRLEQAEQARQRAEAASRAKSEFVSRMSHELRTPLNAMLGFAQLLGLEREPPLSEHQRNRAQQIQRAGWHLLDLINDTLDLARIESGAVQLQVQAVDLVQLVAGCADLVSTAAAARRVDLALEMSLDLPPVAADATRLKQIVTNLLSNAVKYNREGGRVTVRAALRPSDGAMSPALAAAPGTGGETGVTLEVADTGLGMTETQLQHLFEPYNRLGREGSGVEGTGIGLVITKRLTEMMGGTLKARSRAGAGSTFTLDLPVAAAAAAEHAASTAMAPAPYRERCVLYIEDNETNIEVMRGVLLQRPQIRLEVAMLGLEGLALARRQLPDLILLDMQLPDLSGLELLRRLMADDETASIPVIVVSADASPVRIEQALTLGAVQYVTKPLALAPFLQALDETLAALDTRFG